MGWYFYTLPKIGDELRWRKRVYVCVGVQDYVRKSDGAESGLIDWQSTCPLCSRDYVFRTGVRNVTPRGVCEPCMLLPRAHRAVRVPVVAKPLRPARVPPVDIVLMGVAEAPHGMSASLDSRARNYAPKLLKRVSPALAKYKVDEIAAGLSDAVAAGRLSVQTVGWNKWRRPVSGLVITKDVFD